MDSINHYISNKINAWKRIYLEPFTAFLSIQKLNELKYNEVEISDEEMEKLRRGLIKGFSKLD